MKVFTLGGTSNSQRCGALVAPAASFSPYAKYGCPAAVKMPHPSALRTATVPVPSVTCGPSWKKMRKPPVVVPLAEPRVVPGIRFLRVTLVVKTCRTES